MLNKDILRRLRSFANRKIHFEHLHEDRFLKFKKKRIKKRDAYLLAKTLMYSDQLPLVYDFEGNRFRLSEDRHRLISETRDMDYSEMLPGSVILLALEKDLTRNEVQYGTKGEIKLKFPIEADKVVPQIIDVYECSEEWLAVETLFNIRTDVSHPDLEDVHITKSEFELKLEKIVKSYEVLGFSVETLTVPKGMCKPFSNEGGGALM